MDKDCFDIRDIKEVSECPKNEEDTYSAALNKSCTLYKPVCCKPLEFVYHCLLSGDGKKYYEFCACTKEISYCAELNLAGRQIQANFHAYCRPGISNSACGRFYNSSRAFEVSECYKQVSPFMKLLTRPGFNKTFNESWNIELYSKNLMQITMHDTQTDSEHANDTANLMDNIMSNFSHEDIRRPKDESLSTTLSGITTHSLNTTAALGKNNSASIDNTYQSKLQFLMWILFFMVLGYVLLLLLLKKIDCRIHSVNKRNRDEETQVEDA